MPERVAAVILAAGSGTRMRSSLPKPLHPVCGRPMIDYVIDAASIPALEQLIVVLSPELNRNDSLLAHLQHRLGDQLGIAIQHEPLGTGDALSVAIPLLRDVETVIVLFADHPLLSRERVASLNRADHAIGLLTCQMIGAAGYGRIERATDGSIRRIVERKDDDPALRSGPLEINSGMMAIDVDWLRSVRERLAPSPATGEIYLTQLVELAVQDGRQLTAVQGDERDLIGINDRNDLVKVETTMQDEIRSALGMAGVTFVNPKSSVVEYGVEIGADTTILPGCLIRAGTRIGTDCEIGPNSVLSNAQIGDNCRISASFITDSGIDAGSKVGPFSHVRGGSAVAKAVHVGNFAEIKNSSIADEARIGHFSYIGDASVGERTNIGAGTVTCNFDGVDKHRTEIGADAFIGSDTMLIAPVTIGERGVTGAGSVVTRDVPPGGRVVGVPARAISRSSRRRGER